MALTTSRVAPASAKFLGVIRGSVPEQDLSQA
jgi:hypothetical protein